MKTNKYIIIKKWNLWCGYFDGGSEEASVNKLHPLITEDVIDFWLEVHPAGRALSPCTHLLLMWLKSDSYFYHYSWLLFDQLLLKASVRIA
jgi:hypothetical protein